MIIWIASYPRSGNTWVRSLLSTHLFQKKQDTVFQNLKKITNFPNKNQFDGIFEINEFTKEEKSNKKKMDKRKFEICKYLIKAQKKINEKKGITFLKTHNFGGSIEGSEFTNLENTLGFIYLVRDPRSVAVSNAYHNNISFEESTNDLLDEKLIATNEGNLLEFRSSWKINYLSWRNRVYPKIIIRYEDLHSNTIIFFKKILSFLNTFDKVNMNEEDIKNTIETCSFKNLSKLENLNGFDEKIGKENFFRKGLINEWSTVLQKNLVKKIEKEFFDEMKELKYL